MASEWGFVGAGLGVGLNSCIYDERGEESETRKVGGEEREWDHTLCYQWRHKRAHASS